MLHHANVFIVKDNLYGIKVVPLTTLAAMKICFRDIIMDIITHPKPCNAMAIVFPRLSSIFDFFFVNIHEYVNEIVFSLGPQHQ